MLESILESNVIYYVMVGAAIGGIVSKAIVSVSLRRLVKAASNMSKSNHGFVKLVRAKFEHACMVNEKVENIGVFVDKYIAEYQVCGMRLYSWQRLEKTIAIFVAILAGVALGVNYYYAIESDAMIRNGIIGTVLTVLLVGVYQLVDEKHRLNALRMYMVDYLENVCARKIAKTNERAILKQDTQTEIQKETLAIQAFASPKDAKKDMELDENQDVFVQRKQLKKKHRKEGGQNKIKENINAVNSIDQVNQMNSNNNDESMVNEERIREILQEFMA